MNILLKQFILGFVVKTLASFDDAFTRLPVIVAVARTRRGKIAFSIGNLLAVLVVVALAIFFSTLIGHSSLAEYVAAALIFVLAGAVYFRLFEKMELRGQEKVVAKISADRFISVAALGFVVSLLTLLDDAVAFLPLFFHGGGLIMAAAVVGILISTSIQIVLVIYLAEQMERLKNRREITVIGLLVYGLLILCGAI